MARRAAGTAAQARSGALQKQPVSLEAGTRRDLGGYSSEAGVQYSRADEEQQQALSRKWASDPLIEKRSKKHDRAAVNFAGIEAAAAQSGNVTSIHSS